MNILKNLFLMKYLSRNTALCFTPIGLVCSSNNAVSGERELISSLMLAFFACLITCFFPPHHIPHKSRIPKTIPHSTTEEGSGIQG